ncbi:XRE family transcriptional regulator [Romboutsia maritimum]|uniref:XRE family transcriptional regulator n=1 Tax=Romboutsia maritimum TaxID=2020948 RepID=A0A371IV58_9FIRM|nr:helix-turn-helix domain-containing protein [Romboutsia maritimum]RDY24367.1 XRE family transcriptional regulator [Romboutsia maritimum]
MISTNLKRLRKNNQYTQEDVAEKINVSRQSVAKWENGESTPDIDSCIKLTKLYKVKLDDLVNYSEEESGIAIPPKGKHFFGAVVVGERGQIVIPKEARELFNIKAGDKLLILGDEEKGIAIVHQRDLLNFVGDLGIAIKE